MQIIFLPFLGFDTPYPAALLHGYLPYLLMLCSMLDWPPCGYPPTPFRLLYCTRASSPYGCHPYFACDLAPNAREAPAGMPSIPCCAPMPLSRPPLHVNTLFPLILCPSMDSFNTLWFWHSTPGWPSRTLITSCPLSPQNQITSTHVHLHHIPTAPQEATSSTWMSHKGPHTPLGASTSSFPPGRDAYHAPCLL